ncbi:hypothetical protein SAMN05216378_1819 [Paenibacillus catalpae]|uniref:Aldouronate transport system substrate-binding protein n=1 Tax=Paenibacillus catalpae TaxID=1045775 RepID=A0A1I1WQA7_9BACL|nr:hypothetical protein [Paenibacillus catalpae]SFD97357.1 hypothetical protein SAMN05216378_1819 [Paenibacillus catalpae]
MKLRMRNTVTLSTAAALLLSLAAGCTNEGNTPAETAAPANATNENVSGEKAYYDMYDEVTDSSELPDWKGKQLKLKIWYAHGTGDAKRPVPTEDIVSPEIKRVTGIEIDKDGSFDNGGQAIDVKLGMINAANDWPDLAFVTDSGMGSLKDMFAAGKAYDLTDAIEKYAPNLQKRLSFETFPYVKRFSTNNDQDGSIYSFPTQMGDPDRSIKMMDPSFVTPNALEGTDQYVWVRDDLLKKLYPEAKTQDEIDALFVEKGGKFSREDIYDVPVKTTEDFTKLLYDLQNIIKTENITENGKPVEVSYAFGGQDNWGTLAVLANLYGRIPKGSNYFTYFDKETQQIEFMFQQPFFKNIVHDFNKLVRDKVMDPNSLVENNAMHLEKLNNGQYAVAYLYDIPDENVMKAAGKSYRYRKVFLDSPVNTDQFISPMGGVKNNIGVVVFKDSVKEEDLPQVVHFLDYMVSEVGEKMYTWGPKSAGLFDEVDGKRVFKDKELEDAMVYNKDNGKSLHYNLANTRLASTNIYGSGWPYYPTYMWGGSKVSPFYSYDRVISPSEARNFFDPGNLPNNSYSDLGIPINNDMQIWNFFGVVPEADQFWKGRDAFEKALTKTLAARDDAHFEELWKQFSEIATKNGGNEDLRKKIDDYFKTTNKDQLESLK